MAGIYKKAGALVIAVVTFGMAGLASAQTFYYSSPSYSTPSYGSSYSMYDQAAYTGACTGITRDLSLGMSGSDVTSLQQFLVSRHYPGGGNWMVTGYFGKATAAAVRNFQGAQGLSATGYVDGPTRLALDRVSCGGSSHVTPSYDYSYVAPTYTTPSYTAPTYTYPYTQPSYVQPTYTYPQYGYGTGCDGVQGSYYYGYSGIGTYYPNCNYYDRNQYTTPTITTLTPQSAAVGASVTVIGNGFSTTGNTVHFGNGVITNLSSSDGRSLSFTLPTQLTGYGSQQVGLGTYYVSVTNSSGYTSNTLPFTVTSLGSYGAPVITNVSGPTNLGLNTQGVWSLTVNNQSGSYLTASVQWGDPQNYAYAQASQQNIATGLQTITFTHSYLQSGTFTIVFTVTNSAGLSNTSSITVNVSNTGSTGSLSIASITPVRGVAGTQIAIQGSGFSTYDNTVHFGNGGTMHVPSYNGTAIYYTIPQYLSPCDVTTGTVCPMYLQFVTPGVYPVSVQNGSGTSNTVNFTVIQ